MPKSHCFFCVFFFLPELLSIKSGDMIFYLCYYYYYKEFKIVFFYAYTHP